MTPFTITGFELDGVPLDLAGRRDEEDCWIDSVKVAGSDHDMTDMLNPKIIDRLAALADAQLALEAKLHNEQMRVDASWAAYEKQRAYA